MKKIFIFMFSIIAITGCNSGSQYNVKNQTQNKQYDYKENMQSTMIMPGYPVKKVLANQWSNELLFPIHNEFSCVDIPKSTKLIFGTRRTFMETKLNLNDQEVLQSLAGDLNLQINKGTKSLAAVVKMAELNKKSSQQFTLSVISNSSNLVSLDSNTKFTQTDFDNCGDGYISSLTAGIYFMAQIEVNFSDDLQKQSITAAIKGNVDSVASLAAALEKIQQQHKNAFSIDLRVIQLGGSTDSLFDLFSKQSMHSDSSLPELYLSSISVDQLKNLQDHLVNYAIKEVPKQADDYFKDLTVKGLSNLMLSEQGMQIKEYKKQSTPVYYDEDSLETLNEANDMYQQLVETYLSYSNYSNIVAMYADTSKFPDLISKLLVQLSVDYDSCLGTMIYSPEYKLSNQCIIDLDRSINNAESLIQTINKSGYMGGYIMKQLSDTSNTEYLIFVKEEKDGTKLFLSYSENFSKAIYSPGALYGFNPLTKTMKLYNSPEYFYAPKKAQVTFTLKNADNVTFIDRSRMSYDKPEYTKNVPSQEDELGLSMRYSFTALEAVLKKSK